MDKPVTVTIIGCGYVGLTTAAILAHCGVTVYALEINPVRLSSIKAGKSFFHEQGIDALLSAAITNGTLIATDDYAQAVPVSNLVFSCVGTPDKPDGSANLQYIFDVAAKVAPLMKQSAVFVQKSTVPVGTGRQIIELFEHAGYTIPYVSNPEFLREGTAVSDTLWFDRIIAGSDQPEAGQAVLGLYKRIETYRDDIARLAGLTEPGSPGLHKPATTEPQYTETQLSSAELIKVSANAFLALKISFANSIAKLADKSEADINEVMDGVGADSRIGRAFLNAGRGYGGGCFPKDVSSLIRSAEDYGIEMDVMHAAADVNASMPHYIINKAEVTLGKTFASETIAVLGLAFKAGTSDARRSPGVIIANTLAEQGAHVQVFDPQAMDEADSELHPEVLRCTDVSAAVASASCVFIATDWPEFRRLDPAVIPAFKATRLIVDCMNCLDVSTYPSGMQYVGVGRTPNSSD